MTETPSEMADRRLPRAAAARLARIAATASLAVALGLVAIKTVAWVMTGSVAMLGSLIDSGLDAAASGLNLLAVRAASEPADRDHRFGHGKLEAVAGLGQATLISASALFLAVEAIRKLVRPEPIAASAVGLAVILVSMAVTIALVLYQRRVVQRTRSLAIKADALHYTSDILMNASVIVALVLADRFHLARADAVCGLFVAALIGRSAAEIMRGAFDQLLDHELAEPERQRIRAIAATHPEVRNVHDLRTRVSGYDTFIQFHIELDPAVALMEAHRISDEVEARVRAAFPNADVIIHEDPAGVERPPVFPPARR